MHQKRILIFNDCFYMGGTEILLVNLLNHLNEKGCDITLLLPNPSEKNVLLERVSEDVPVRYFHPKELKGLKRWIFKNILIFYPRLFAKLTGFDAYEYDEIVCFKDGFYSILFSKIDRPKYLWVHNQPFVRDYTGKNLKEKLSYALNKKQIKRMYASFDKFDRVICVSDSCKRGYIDIYHGGTPKKDIEVLYNALDLSGITERAKEPISLPKPERFSFVVVIRLSYEKTVDRAIIAVDKLLKEGYDLEMHILGDGAEFDKLRTLITELGRDDRITMHGRVGNPFPYMRRADWFLCPSSRESFALTLLESITIGTPIITTDCGGPEDVIMRGKYGIFVENSLEGVIEGMKKAMDNPELRSYYNDTAEENLSRFSYPRWLKAVDEILGV
ncbi:MAG TPA: glycosyltransferase [Dysgonomonas sp.]|nr:glycosyltransferase [Dysgonomonas sp.]